MRAIVSDVHGNAEALKAVLEDIDKRGITEIFSLGDLVGYGPEPEKCIELARNFKISLCGNHEAAILFDSEGFSKRAKDAVEWTRGALEKMPAVKGDPFEFIGSLARRHTEGELIYVHGSPREPVQEYIFPTDVKRVTKMKSIFSRIKTVCFVGHTHYAGVLTDSREFFQPPELCNIYVVDPQVKAIINVGSVGQPRDSNPKAGYVTFDGDTVVFHRVDYDVQKTTDMIINAQGLDDSLGTRLLSGK